jgi:hypothetical protein
MRSSGAARSSALGLRKALATPSKSAGHMPAQGHSPGEELAPRGCQNLVDRYGCAGENPHPPDGSIGRRLDLVGNPLRFDHEQNLAPLPRFDLAFGQGLRAHGQAELRHCADRASRPSCLLARELRFPLFQECGAAFVGISTVENETDHGLLERKRRVERHVATMQQHALQELQNQR